MGDQRIRLAIVSGSTALRERILAHADPFYFELVERGAIEELPVPNEGDTKPVVVVIAEEGSSSTAVAIGVQDVVKLENLTSMRLRDVAMASLAKDRRLRELKLERNRAIIQNELAAGFANATSGLQILETLADGLIALGASTVSCWRAVSDTLELVVARGSQAETEREDLARADHPLRQVLERNETLIQRERGLRIHVPLIGVAGPDWVVRAAVEGSPSETRVVGLEQVVRHAAEALERVRLRRNLDAEHARMRALLESVRNDADPRLVADVLEDAGPPVELNEDAVEPLDLRELAASSGLPIESEEPIEVSGDPAAIGRALRALRRTLSRREGGSARVRADGHAAYVELSALDREPTALREDPAFALAQRVCGVHGGHAWIEGDDANRRVCLQIPRRPRRAVPPSLSLSDVREPRAAADDAQLVSLRDAFRSDKLGSLLDLWAGARGRGPLPHPDRVRGATMISLRPDLAEVRVSYDHADDPTFTWTMIGARLERRLGGTLVGEVAAGPSGVFLTDLLSHYRRCAGQARPSYDYLRARGDSQWSFERLLLPCSRDASERVSDILALVLFDGF